MIHLKKISALVVALIILIQASTVLAAGNIDTVQKYSQFLNTDIDGNGVKDFINWHPTAAGPTVGATVTDSAITGSIFGETVGWINLGPFNTDAGSDAGVKNTCSGILSGKAFGENTGWINFSPTSTLNTLNQPKINTTTGAITGTVWSQNYGWIQLSSPNGTYPGLITSWNGCTTTTTPPPGGGGGGGGSGTSGNCTLPLVWNGTACVIPVTPNPPVNSTPPTNPVIVPNPDSVPIIQPSTPGTTNIPIIHGTENIALTPPFMTGDDIFLGFNIPILLKSLAPIIGVIGLLSSIPGLVTRFGNMILAFIFGRKKHRGIVYDSVTKEPLDPAYVSVIDVSTGQEITSQITDMKGRYGFILKKGSYRLIVGKTHYAFPSVNLAGRTSDAVYGDLYFGEIFTITDAEQVVTMNIPMDPVGTDWNQEEKRRMSPIRFFLRNEKVWGRVFDFLFLVGFTISLIITIYYPVWWNVLMLCMYAVIALTKLFGFGPIRVGKVTKAGIPLAYAVIRVYGANLNHEVGHKVTTNLGGYYLLVPKGEYYITIEEKNQDGTYTKIYSSSVMKASHGVISKSFDL